MTTDICSEFGHYIARTRYEDLPVEAIESAKKSILDTLGVTLAASGMEPAVRNLVDMVREGGGKPESTLLGYGERVPAAMAAFANGAMAHSLDFDDQTPWGAHSSSSIIPSVFALAERVGGVSGKTLITAVAIGQDIFARLRCNVGWHQNWNLSSVVGVFSAAAAASHVLGLSPAQATHALGIASMQCSGTMEVIFATGSDLRGMYAGFTAKGAVYAALLAQRGITGIESLFEGKAGIVNVYFGSEYDRAKIVEGLGREFMGATTLYKAWPAVGNAHTYLHATIELMKEHRLDIGEIDQIRVYVGDFGMQMSMPLEQRRAPQTLVDAKFSLPYCVAVVAARGQLKVSDFTPAALNDPFVLSIAKKVVPIEDSNYNWTMKLPNARVEIVARDGRRMERIGDKLPGSLEAPLSWDDLMAKFRDCASLCAVPLSAENIAAAQALVRSLDGVQDVSELLQLLH